MHRLLTVLTLASACAASPEQITAEPYYGSASCPEDDCGMNSDYMGGYFSELKWHAWNQDRFFLKRFIHPIPAQQVDRLEVDKDHFIPVDVNGNQVTGASVDGTILVLENEDGVVYWLRIAAVNDDARFWATNSTMQIETYTLEYTKIDPEAVPGHEVYNPFCRNEPLAGHPQVLSDAVAFEGELYNPKTKEIVPTVEGDGWFNLSCLGSAPAKMFMMRHTLASSNENAGITTTSDERQAFLNAWAGNYCGDGQSFTQTGEKVRFRDDKGWIDHTSGWSWPDFVIFPNLPFKTYEAIWDKTGAVCLDEPRRLDSDAGVYNDIQDHCRVVRNAEIPKCTNRKLGITIGNWQSRGHLLTVNPYGS